MEPQGSCCWAGGGNSAYLCHGGWVLKAWSHRWLRPAVGESSSAPSVPGPRAYRACSTKGHSEEDLKGEGSGRGGPDPKPQRQTHNGPEDAEGPAAWTHSLARSEEGRRCAGRDAGAGEGQPGWVARGGVWGGSSVSAGSRQRRVLQDRVRWTRAEDPGRAQALAEQANLGALAIAGGGPPASLGPGRLLELRDIPRESRGGRQVEPTCSVLCSAHVEPSLCAQPGFTPMQEQDDCGLGSEPNL